ncbi:hypothetical protein M9H77_26860 [Catharanthus roseus]|uniref:Uncharacterized protein n=1 Tax=Catharanthus roseus TaxID=4058 RepID=A0ACC0ADK1_CATRO|nr:hypothetical protein M9H77_26860 [Catharanthus roseus]
MAEFGLNFLELAKFSREFCPIQWKFLVNFTTLLWIIAVELHPRECTNLILGYISGYDHMFGSIRELHYSGEWIHLKRGVDRGGCGLIGLRGHCIMLCGGVGCLVDTEEGIETKVGLRADLKLTASPPEWEVEPRIESKIEDDPMFRTTYSMDCP